MKYEQATALRDRLQALTWLDDRLTFLRTARRGGAFVYPLAGASGETLWYLIQRGEVCAVLREPRTPAERDAAAEFVDATFAEPDGESRVTDRTVDSVLLVAGWFKKYPAEKGRLLRTAQLSAAPSE
jgi:excinuclease ABC subunit C